MEVSKKSFEFKISKKVAELIQVVHMLFTKNHEREIELQATKDAYEEEIANVIRDARNRLEQLQQTLTGVKSEKRRFEIQVKKLELEAQNQEEQYQRKLCEVKQKVIEGEDRNVVLQKQNEKLFEQLKQTQSEHDKLQEQNEHLICKLQQQQEQIETGAKMGQSAINSQTTDLTAALSECKAELERRQEELKKLHTQLELHKASTLKAQYEKLIDQLKCDFNETKVNLKTDTHNLQQQLFEIRRENQRLEEKNKHLEIYMKQMKENELRSSSVSSVNEQKQVPTNSANQVPYSQTTNRSMSVPVALQQQGSYNIDPREEVEKLKREIRRYRMELSNREGNFNRMFTDTSPIRLAGKVGRLAVTRSKTDLHMKATGDGKQQGSPMPNNHIRRRVGHHERLPALSMDFKQRTTSRMETFDHHL